MWTFSKDQMERMFEVRRREFERQTSMMIVEKNRSQYVVEHEVKNIVHHQMDYIMACGITDLQLIISFFEMSMIYPVLSSRPLSEKVEEILKADIGRKEKLGLLESFCVRSKV